MLEKKWIKNIFDFSKGFTLIELLIVVSVLVIISSIGVGSYMNYNKSVQINSVVQTVVFDLKQAQSKAMNGEGGYKWGIHFVNSATDYYEIFSTPTDYTDESKVIISTNYLAGSVLFTDPADSFVKNIIFSQIRGGTTATSVVLTSQDVTKTISVTNIGSISVQ